MEEKQMKKLTCEMCGGTDLVKQDGVFVCQNCGTKYSVEEAKKLLVEGTVEVKGTVDVKGTVSIDSSKNLENLYQAARNAREAGDEDSAIKTYESISAIDPNSWEALFYRTILRTESITYGEIENAAVSVSNCIPKVFDLISSNMEKDEMKAAVKEVITQCRSTAYRLLTGSNDFNKSLNNSNMASAIVTALIVGGRSNGALVADAMGEAGNNMENINRCKKIITIMQVCGSYIEKYFDMKDADYRKYAAWSWKSYITLGDKLLTEADKDRYIKKIDELAPPSNEEIKKRVVEKNAGINKAKKTRKIACVSLIAIWVVAFIVSWIVSDGEIFDGDFWVLLAVLALVSPLWIIAIAKMVKSGKVIKKLNIEISELNSNR